MRPRARTRAPLAAGAAVLIAAALAGGTPAVAQVPKTRTPGQLEPADTADPVLAKVMAGHLKGQPTAEEYVVGLFKNHDLVFLGEEHFTRPRLLFLQRLIPRLYEAGIRTLAYEMASSEDQELVDRLVNGAAHDEALGSEILARWDFYFGYREYARFDVRRFHDAVIGSGSMPLSVLEEHVDWFIHEEQRASAAR
jgi:hypothetical protein